MGRWHIIRIRKEGKQIELIVNSNNPSSTSSAGSYVELTMTSGSYYYIGGHPNPDKMHKDVYEVESFNGCIHHVGLFYSHFSSRIIKNYSLVMLFILSEGNHWKQKSELHGGSDRRQECWKMWRYLFRWSMCREWNLLRGRKWKFQLHVNVVTDSCAAPTCFNSLTDADSKTKHCLIYPKIHYR